VPPEEDVDVVGALGLEAAAILVSIARFIAESPAAACGEALSMAFVTVALAFSRGLLDGPVAVFDGAAAAGWVSRHLCVDGKRCSAQNC
jgi:hypothetical protein